MPTYNEVEDDVRRRRSRRASYSPTAEPARDRSRSREYRRISPRGHHRPREHRDSQRFRSRSRDRSHRKRSYSPEDSASRRNREEKRRRGIHHADHDQGRSRSQKHRTSSTSRSPPRRRVDQVTVTKGFERSKAPLPDQQDAFNGTTALAKGTSPVPDKQKPNFAVTGRLAAESNTIKSVHGQSIVLKYHEPSEARKPSPRDAWRMYVFKGADIIDTVELAEQSCWLFGREASVADVFVEHPSCSKQHAVVQFRYVESKNEFGDKKGKVKPYVIDLESANGTNVNGEAVPGGRYVEVRDKDIITFGHSTREYVMQLPSGE